MVYKQLVSQPFNKADNTSATLPHDIILFMVAEVMHY